MLSRALLRAHPFQFFPGFACVFVLSLEGNKQRLLLGKPPFTLDYFALDTFQLVIDSLAVHVA